MRALSSFSSWLVCGAVLTCFSCTAEAGPPAKSALRIDHEVVDIHGKKVSLSAYRGKALLIVNVASECGFTPQYAELEQLHRRYADRGFSVLGFPSDDFGGQEPGSREEILAFARSEYGVSFPLFDKVHARGKEIAPLYRDLTGATDASLRGDVLWNFEKFVVAPDGRVVDRMRSTQAPLSSAVVAAIERVLPPPSPGVGPGASRESADAEMSLAP